MWKSLINVCFLVILLLFFITGSCKKDLPMVNKVKLTGLIQKGPFIIGTTVLLSELNSTLGQTGKTFLTQIVKNSGSFEFDNVTLSSNYVELASNGFYFDEVKGIISISPLNLYAISDITNISTVNINILTDLEKQRVTYLVTHNNSFTEAKKIAQTEILSIFGFNLTEFDNSEKFDISVDSENNAVLLAVSIILQGNRSVGELSELLAKIKSDIREDGLLRNDSILTVLRTSTKELVLTSIRSNLAKCYKELGIDASIPGFERYINDFLVFTGEKPTVIDKPITNLMLAHVTLNARVNANSFNTKVIFEFGTSNSYGNSMSAIPGTLTGFDTVEVHSDLQGLAENITYHCRVKAENSLGITYGDDMTFTYWMGKVNDIDGNEYNYVTIGSQVWMTENLRTTKYRNGDLIQTTQSVIISDQSTPKYQWVYKDDLINLRSYGRLYTGFVASESRSLCPVGWHIPSKNEWTALITYLGGDSLARIRLKESGTTHWRGPNDLSTNESGFTALPGGSFRDSYLGGSNFSNLHSTGLWWGTPEGDSGEFFYLLIGEYSLQYGFSVGWPGQSVRCIGD
jgi:uncharacterized protein (TIGR02145 family)